MNIRREKGFLLFTVVVMLVVVAAIAFLVSYDSSLKADRPTREIEASRADYLAEAAMQHALWQNNNNACTGDYNILSTALGSDSYSVTVDSAATTTSGTFYPDRDAWIKEAAPNDNFGSEAELAAKNKAGDSHRALYHFDLSSIPAGSKVVSATNWFYVTVNDNEGAVEIHSVTAAWTESTATWTNVDKKVEPTVIGSIPSQSTSGVWVPINMTALAQQWVNNSGKNHGFVLIATSTDLESKYSSREYSGSLRPYLEITTAVGGVSPVQISATGTLASGVSRTLTRVDAPAHQTPASFVIQPGAALEDAYTWDGAHDSTNFGAATTLSVNNASAERTTFIRFDLAAMLPPNVRVTSAVLGLYLEGGGGLSNGVLDMHPVTRSWVEGIYDDQSPPPGGGVTYNSFDGQTNWTSPGGDYDPVPVDTVTIPALTPGWYDWDVTDQLRAWLRGEPNHGLLLRASGGTADKIEFTSGDSPTANQHPRLTLMLACECGVICAAPQGSGNVLLVVADPTILDPSDAFKKSLFETWGYTVNLQNDDAGQTSFDSKFATNDVVYVSEKVVSASVGTKLTNAPIGVVSEEGALNDELGIASSEAAPVGSTINISDNSHFITQPFATGPLNIYTVDMRGMAVAGTEAPGLQTLGDWSGAGGPVVLDEGAALSGGGNAAGRRVLLPIGNNIDLSEVNNNGRLIVQRALAWGMKADGGGSGDLLLVVGNATTPSSIDSGKNALIESWGYAVTLMDDGDSQANLYAAAAANDVVYITESVADGTLADKLSNSTVGIVNENSGSLDDFGFGSDVPPDTVTADLFTATDAGHYITEPFGGWGVTQFTTNITMPWATGTLAPDLQSVASIGTGWWALPTLDTGAQRWDGAPSTGRRVHLPFGAAAASQLTTDGKTLMRRSIEWGAGSGCGSMKPLLLVVSDASNPSSQESARQTLIESWCYAVTLIDDDATTVEYAAAMALNDVMYISQEITNHTNFSKLKDAPIGMVNEEYLISSNLGFGAGTGSGFFNDINIVDNTHYITSGFGLGPLALFSPTYDIYTGTGFTLAPDLQVLGEAGSITGLMALETGGALWDAGNAAGRRVQVPWGDDFNALNADGQTIMRRAIEWAAAVASFNRLLFVVTDAASPSADEIERQTLVESWGYVVTRISDEDSQADFDVAASSNDLAYISGDALYNNVGIKLKAATIGVAFESYQLHDEFGLSPGGIALANLQSITIIDSSHYITTPYAGSVNVTMSNTQLSAVSSFAPDTQLQLLASIPSYDGALATFDTGDVDHWGETVAGRRVKLPWGSTDWGFDFSSLSADGQNILKRSLEWVAGADDGGAPLLFVVGDPVSLTTLDAGRKAQFESWGYSVTLIDDADSVANFSTALAATDVVYVGSSINSSALSGKLEDSAVGIVNEAGLMIDNFGLNGGSQFVTDVGLDIVAADHYIASDFSTSSVTIFTTSISMVVLGASPAPDLVTVAEPATNGPNPSSVATLETGAERYDSTPSAGRRVHLPTASAEVSQLTADGLTLMRRAIEWAAESGGGGGGGCADTFRDEFNAQVWSGSDGTLAWATNWLEWGEGGTPTGGDIMVMDDMGPYSARVRDNGTGDTGAGIRREADLSAYATATLSFEYRRDGPDNANDYATVDVSDDGGASWTELDRFIGEGNNTADVTYQPASYDISAFMAPNTRVRFLTSPSMGKQDSVFFDNVEICVE